MNQLIRRRAVLSALGAAGVAQVMGWPAAALAESYPSRPVRFINPFAPGGSADVLSRLIATKLGQVTGTTFFVDNIGGAGGTIGSDKVAKASPDGYTMLLSNVAPLAIAPGLYSKLPYDPVKDFEHIALFGQFPNVLLVGPQVKARTFAEFLAEAKSRGAANSFTFGSAGNGSSPHLCGELLKLRAGIHAQHIPFKGAGPALLAVMSGELSFQFENISTAIPQINGGKLRALGVTGAKRSASLPDVPTMQELGLRDFVVGAWYGISAPARTPAEIVQVIAKATATALADPTLQAKLAELGVEPPPVAPGKVKAYVAAEGKRWGDLIKRSGAKLD
jgi:tripartite-type tricarboxylate transporter receptor subunit TctC